LKRPTASSTGGRSYHHTYRQRLNQ